MTSTCIVASYGPATFWGPLTARALASTAQQTRQFDAVLHLHLPGGTLAEVRNRAAEVAQSEWLCFLDADDELDPGYNDAMLAGEGDVRWPSIRYDDGEAFLPGGVTQEETAWIVIGAFIRREAFLALGGFAEMDRLEDWDLWRRAERAGLALAPCEGALYLVHLRPGSRNDGNWALARQRGNA